MAEQSGFFNANLVNGEFDRVYLAEHFAKYFASFIGNGIFGGKSNELMVTQPTNSGMKVEMLSGMGWINGYWYENTSNLSLDISVADGVLNRIDNIVIKFGNAERRIWAEVVRGTPASVAVAPEVRRDSDYFELKLAEVHVRAGVVNITQAEIVDTRLDSEVCGFVVGVIQQFDTTEFGKQLNGYISNYANEYRAFLDALEVSGTKELESLIERLNALAVDENVLASLALEIDEVASKTAIINQTLGYSKKNMLPYPFTFTTRVSNGITWTDNGDGTITANGTATESAYFTLYRGKALDLGKYLVSSNVDLYGKHFSFIRFINRETSLEIPGTTRFGFESIPIEITESDAALYDLFVGLSISKGTTVSNLVFKPMVRKAEIIDSTWAPYRLGVNELLNVPNKPGIEYLLPERWNDKPVYQKTFYTASLPNNSIMAIEVAAAFTKIISISGFALDTDSNLCHPFPVIKDGVTPIAIIREFEGDGGGGGNIVVKTTTNVTNLQAYITIKYTKE